MARTARRRDTAPEPPSPAGSNALRWLFVGGVFVGAAVAGVLIIRSQVGPGQPVVDIDALERQEDIRMASVEKLTRSEALIGDGKLDEARRLLQQVTEADPNLYLGHLLLGYVFMQTNKLPLAAQATRRAYELEPQDPAVNYQMGHTELMLGNVESAIDFLARAIRLRRQADLPPAPEYHVALADALGRNELPDQAASQMNLALAADREEAIAAAAMVGPEAQVALARALVRRQEMADAARLFAHAAEQRPDRPEWQYLAARAYFVQGKFPQAASLIQRAIDLDPANGRYVQLKRKIDAEEFGAPRDESAEDADANATPAWEDLFDR